MDAAAADPDDLASARMLEKIMEEIATSEARCKELEKQLAAEPDHNENILAAIRAGWIIPNWFEQEHFDAMEGWDKDCLNQFVHYLNRAIFCRYDFVRQGIEEVLEDFLAGVPE